MDEEINRQILERDAEFTDDFDASVLWVLHRVFGFGPACGGSGRRSVWSMTH